MTVTGTPCWNSSVIRPACRAACRVPLSGLPPGTTALRLRTNQEIYWDRVAVVQAEPLPQARRTALPLAEARVAETGFARRSTGPQRQPHYDYAQRSPLWDTRHMAGHYTAFGPATELVAAVDDATAIIGPGRGSAPGIRRRATVRCRPAGAAVSWSRPTAGPRTWTSTQRRAQRWNRYPRPDWQADRVMRCTPATTPVTAPASENEQGMLVYVGRNSAAYCAVEPSLVITRLIKST